MSVLIELLKKEYKDEKENILKNSIYLLKEKILFSSTNDNIFLSSNVFLPIFILEKANIIKELEDTEKEENLLNKYLQLEKNNLAEKYYEKKFEELYKEFKITFKDFEDVKERENEELYIFLQNNSFKNNGVIEDKIKFVVVIQKLYKLIYLINLEVYNRVKSLEELHNIFLASLFYESILSYIGKTPKTDELDISELRKEINKNFILNKMNAIFYNILIDFHILSMEEILFSGISKKIINTNIEKLVKVVFEDSIRRVNTYIREYKLKKDNDNYDSYFTLENFNKVKKIDFINIEFDKRNIGLTEQEVQKIELNKEAIKFYIITKLIEKKYIRDLQNTRLKNIKIIILDKIKENNDKQPITHENNIIYLNLKLEKDNEFLDIDLDLELEIELELVIKIFNKKDERKILEQEKEKEILEIEEKTAWNLQVKNDSKFIGLRPEKIGILRTQSKDNSFFRTFLKYRNRRSAIYNQFNYIDLLKIDKFNFNEKIDIIEFNINSLQIMANSKYDTPLSRNLLDIYLYIYLQVLYLRLKTNSKPLFNKTKQDNEQKNKFSFDDFLKTLRQKDINNTRHQMLEFIKYLKEIKYKWQPKETKSYIRKSRDDISQKNRKILDKTRELINDDDEYLLIRLTSEFIFLQTLHRFYLKTEMETEIKNIFKFNLFQNGIEKENKLIKTIFILFKKYRDEFSTEFDLEEKEDKKI